MIKPLDEAVKLFFSFESSQRSAFTLGKRGEIVKHGNSKGQTFIGDRQKRQQGTPGHKTQRERDLEMLNEKE